MLGTTIALLSMLGVMVAALITTVVFLVTRVERRLERLEGRIDDLEADLVRRFDALAIAIADIRGSP